MKRLSDSSLWLLWLTVVPTIIGTIVLLLIFALPYGIGLGWLFLSAETAIGYLRFALGVPLLSATILAIVCGQLDLLNWFWLADQIGHVAEYMLRKAERLNTMTNGALHDHARRWPYLVIFVLALLPSCTVAGVAMSKICGLKTRSAIAIMATGNSVKMIVFAIGFSDTIPFFTSLVERFKR